MAKDINLTSRRWSDIVFEGRPKDYGAYEIRLSSTRRHIVAFLCVVALVAVVASLPKLIETVANMRPQSDNLSDDTTLADLALLEEVEKQDEIVQQTIVEPPPPLKSTIQFVAPVIVADEEIAEDELIKSQTELQTSTAQVSLFDVEGDDEELGVDKAELVEQQKIAGDAEVIHDFVQQMPQFPGGNEELMKYLYAHIQYPRIALENNISGTATVRFAVMKDGSIGNLSVLQSPDRSLSDEATRVIKGMPKWIPGMLNGKPVNVYYVVPVHFRINQE